MGKTKAKAPKTHPRSQHLHSLIRYEMAGMRHRAPIERVEPCMEAVRDKIGLASLCNKGLICGLADDETSTYQGMDWILTETINELFEAEEVLHDELELILTTLASLKARDANRKRKKRKKK